MVTFKFKIERGGEDKSNLSKMFQSITIKKKKKTSKADDFFYKKNYFIY